MIEHCISSLKSNSEKKSFEIYVTDALMAIADNTTHLLTMNGVVDYGRTIKTRWVDMLEPPPEEPKEPEDNRSSEEIANDIWSRIRGH